MQQKRSLACYWQSETIGYTNVSSGASASTKGEKIWFFAKSNGLE
jgi:hypothetical protein